VYVLVTLTPEPQTAVALGVKASLGGKKTGVPQAEVTLKTSPKVRLARFALRASQPVIGGLGDSGLHERELMQQLGAVVVVPFLEQPFESVTTTVTVPVHWLIVFEYRLVKVLFSLVIVPPPLQLKLTA
jgi:hypothetical protein